jgi:saposin
MNYVDTFFPIIFQDIVDGIDSLSICGKIGLCSSNAKKLSRKLLARLGFTNSPTGFFCDVCQDIVLFIEQAVLEGYLEREIESLVSAICQDLPAPFSAICSTCIEEYVSSTLEWIEDGINSLEICGKIGICSPASHRTAMKLRPAIHKKSTLGLKTRSSSSILFCDICEAVVSLVEKLVLEGFVRNEIRSIVANLCSNLPSPDSVFCAAFIDEGIDLIITEVEAGVAAFDVCTRIGLCESRITKREKGTNPRDVLRDVCRDAVDYIAQLVHEGYVEREIQILVDDFCHRWSVPLSRLCQSVLDEYIEEIIVNIEAGLDSLNICGLLGMCDTKNVGVKSRRLVGTRAAKRISKGVMCALCQEIVSEVGTPEGRKRGTAVIENVCMQAESPVGPLCEKYMKQYDEMIVKDVDSGMGEFEICSKIGVCGPTMERSKEKARRPVVKIE